MGVLNMLFNNIKDIVNSLDGKIGIYFMDLNTGEEFNINGNEKFVAASIIKLPVMVEFFNRLKLGELSREDKVKVRHEDKLPSSGALTYMHDGLEVTLSDLCTLMIVLSDNTATNILIKKLGIENINKLMAEMGMTKTRINRLLFDVEEQIKGKENYFTPLEIGRLLLKIYQGNIITSEMCIEMEDILKNQRINHKVPYPLTKKIEIAHKTGEDAGTTHEAGIFYSKNPFILCFAANNTDVPSTEEAIRSIIMMCYEKSME
jgi:beta-lactamase class A